MALFKTGNPALQEQSFSGLDRIADEQNAMTLQGTVNKTALLLLALLLGAMYTWRLFNSTGNFAAVQPLLWIGAIGGFVVGLVIVVKKELAPYLAVVYAVLEGLCLGGLSAATNRAYPGIAFESFLLTFGILAVLLVVYTLRIIKPTENFKLIVVSATGGIAFYYLLSLGLSFFGIHAPLVTENSWLGIGFSLVVIGVASLNLVLDFDFIEQGAAKHVPKYMEWYGAFGLLVTLVWLYLELLRLLSKLRSRD